MKDFPLKTELRIDWSELDLLGHVNNLAILKYIQTARIKFLDTIGIAPMHANEGFGAIMAHVSGQFRKPLYYPGDVTVYTRVRNIKTTSFSLQNVVMDKDENVIAESEDVIVYYDFSKKEKAVIPDEIKGRLRKKQ